MVRGWSQAGASHENLSMLYISLTATPFRPEQESLQAGLMKDAHVACLSAAARFMLFSGT